MDALLEISRAVIFTEIEVPFLVLVLYVVLAVLWLRTKRGWFETAGRRAGEWTARRLFGRRLP